MYIWPFSCYNGSANEEQKRQVFLANFLQNYESEALCMLTVLFVIAVLFGASSLLSLIDGHATSSEVGSYLRYEYNASMLSRL